MKNTLQDGVTVIGTPSTVAGESFESADECCKAGVQDSDSDLLLACNMETTEEDIVFSYDTKDKSCTKRYNEVVSNKLPSDGSVIGIPDSTPRSDI